MGNAVAKPGPAADADDDADADDRDDDSTAVDDDDEGQGQGQGRGQGRREDEGDDEGDDEVDDDEGEDEDEDDEGEDDHEDDETEARDRRNNAAPNSPGWLEAKRSRLKPSSYRAIDDAWRVYVVPRWGTTPVSAISHSDVRTWVSQLAAGTAKSNRRDHIRTRGQAARPKSATVVIRAHGVLASVLDIAVKDRRIPHNPARGVDNLPRKHRKAHRYLSHEEIERLATASGEYSTLVYLASYTGLRWGELTALRVRHVDALRRRLAVNENAVRVGAEIHVGSPKRTSCAPFRIRSSSSCRSRGCAKERPATACSSATVSTT